MITGTYNNQRYIIYSDGEEIYRAGNSPHDSQVYLPAKEGVGLATMMRYCWHTAKMMSAERREKYGGIKIG